ncbi:MAG TPA: carbohydrate porin [Chthoniobacterales bacterium]|nr:carbohydrate porin [Chthoniobacterales bacterium]
MKSLTPIYLATALLASASGLVHAGTATTNTDVTVKEESSLQKWWDGKYLTGDWLGVRDTLEDHGLTFSGNYQGVFYGVVDSQRGSRGFYDMQINFGAELNLGKALNVEELNGIKAFGNVRYRDSWAGSNPNNFVQANSMFNPSNFQSGTQWRLLSFGLEIGTADNLPVKDMIVLRGGWLQPQKEFIDQPLSKLFVNNTVNSAKGVGGNIPFSSSLSNWGGTLKVKPVDWYYAKGGLFLADPSPTASSNHGLAMAGYGPDPSQNGLMAMAETGVTPKFGAAELPGKYAFGGYYWGVDNKSYNGVAYQGQYGFYAQADQMLFRESSPEPEPMAKGPSDGKAVAKSDGKSFKEVKEVTPPAKLSDQGLSMFNLISFAPKYNNLFPFYFQTGLVYTGLIPSRDKDLTMFSVAYGSYSFYNIEALQEADNINQPNYTMIFEWDYRFAINGFSYIQPMAQYIVKPNGTGNVQNATVLGFQVGCTF